MTRTRRHAIASLLAASSLYAAARLVARRWQESRYSLADRVVLITGGSRGLGLLLAREYARRGAKLILVARGLDALERACDELRRAGAEVLGAACDVTDEAQVSSMVRMAVERFGRIDIVVNDAGQITVGPLESMTRQDFESAMDTNFWGAFHVTNAALPHLSEKRARVVNISSIGGLSSVPHLLPYCVSKFALTGFSLGLRPELAQRGVSVVTVCPGLMRTGSPVNVSFKGDSAAEYAWFTVADSLPLLSLSGSRAARAIVRASQRGDALVVLGMPAKLAAFANAWLPGGVVRAFSWIVRWLPKATRTTAVLGTAIERRPPRWLTALSDRAALRNNELARGEVGSS